MKIAMLDGGELFVLGAGVWASFVFLLVPKQLGLPLSIMASGFPDLVYLLIASAVVGLIWAVIKAVWTYAILRPERRDERAALGAAAQAAN